MNATEIGSRLAKDPDVDECRSLHAAIDARRSEINARLQQITPSASPGVIPDPPEIRQAVTSTAALAKLDEELRLLRVEFDQLTRLGFLVNEAAERALNEQARREIPSALKKLPTVAAKIRKANAALDAVIAEFNGDIAAVLGHYDRLPGGKLPIDDAQLADVTALRNELWQPKMLNVLQIPWMPETREAYPLTWALQFEARGGAKHTEMVITTRKPPKQVSNFAT